MNNQTINGKQMKYVIGIFIAGTSIIGGTTAKSNQDGWISILLAIVIGLCMVFVYDAILRLYPGENLFQIAINIFGGILGKIICCIYVFYAIHIGSLILNVFTEFVHLLNMPETPKVIIAWFMILPCIYLVYSGLGVLGRLSKFVYPFIFATLLFTIIFSIKNMDFSNLQPVLSTDIKDLLSSTYTVFALPIAEIIVITTLFSVDAKENYRKIFSFGIILGMTLLLAIFLRNLLVLGVNGLKTFFFSGYQAASIIYIGNFFTGLEVIIGINILLAGFFNICICCFSSAIGLAKILNVAEYKYLAVPGAIIIITLAEFSFKNTIIMNEFVTVYQYYAIPYQLILPVLILVIGLIKKKLIKAPAKVEEPQETSPETDY